MISFRFFDMFSLNHIHVIGYPPISFYGELTKIKSPPKISLSGLLLKITLSSEILKNCVLCELRHLVFFSLFLGYETTYRTLLPPHLRLRESYHITYLKRLKQEKGEHFPDVYGEALI